MELLQIVTKSGYLVPVILFLAAHTVIFITACVTIYVRVMTRLRELEIRINMVEKNESEIFEKLDKLLESSHRIEMNMLNKKDRDNH
jgi:ABC-type proline/glycine betaine transport system permease subunit